MGLYSLANHMLCLVLGLFLPEANRADAEKMGSLEPCRAASIQVLLNILLNGKHSS